MTLHRRTLLAAAPALVASPAFAAEPCAPIAAPMADYERDTGGHVGVYARNLATGAELSWRSDQRFVMCSSFKLSLAALVLSRVDRGRERLDQAIAFGPADLQEYAPVAREALARAGGVQARLTVEEMCKAAVELSDNTCANLLLHRVGGPAAMTAFWRGIGDRVTRLDHDEPMLNRTPPGRPEDTTTPAAMASNLQRLILGNALSPASRGRLTGWMIGCKTGDSRLRKGLPGAWRIGDKTGNNGKDAAGDIAVAWPKPGRPIVICVYTRGGSPTPAQLEAVFAGIGEMVGRRLG